MGEDCCNCGCHEEETKIAKKGDMITAEKCPKCNDKLVVQIDKGTEVFVCENCKFKVKSKKK